MLDLDKYDAEIIISALLSKISDMRTHEIILENKIENLAKDNERLAKKLSCSESGAIGNG